jgi:micrococcal nuclease
MKQMLLIGCCIILFTFPVLMNLSLQAEDIDIKVQGNTIRNEGIDVKVQDYATEMKGILQRPQDACLKAQNVATIFRVVDGDTLKVNYDGKTELIKLIGIDAPENKLSRKAKDEAVASKENLVTIVSRGIDAEKFMKNLVKKGDIVTIEFDAETRDINGNLIGYIFLANGKMLNEEIVRAGYAHVVTTSHNAKYYDRLSKAYAEAKAHKRGFWE